MVRAWGSSCDVLYFATVRSAALAVRTREPNEEFHRNRLLPSTFGLDIEAIHGKGGSIRGRQLKSERVPRLLETLGCTGNGGLTLQVEDGLDQLPPQPGAKRTAPSSRLAGRQLGVPDDNTMKPEDDVHRGEAGGASSRPGAGTTHRSPSGST